MISLEHTQSLDHLLYLISAPRWTSLVRVEMVKGLYKKHLTDHPLLLGFNEYLHADLGNKNCKQEVSELN